jgi:hypothetical protein
MVVRVVRPSMLMATRGSESSGSRGLIGAVILVEPGRHSRRNMRGDSALGQRPGSAMVVIHGHGLSPGVVCRPSGVTPAAVACGALKFFCGQFCAAIGRR